MCVRNCRSILAFLYVRHSSHSVGVPTEGTTCLPFLCKELTLHCNSAECLWEEEISVAAARRLCTSLRKCSARGNISTSPAFCAVSDPREVIPFFRKPHWRLMYQLFWADIKSSWWNVKYLALGGRGKSKGSRFLLACPYLEREKWLCHRPCMGDKVPEWSGSDECLLVNYAPLSPPESERQMLN